MERHSDVSQCLTQFSVSLRGIILLASPLKEHCSHGVGNTRLVIGQMDGYSCTGHLQTADREAVQLSRGGNKAGQIDDHFISQFTTCWQKTRYLFGVIIIDKTDHIWNAIEIDTGTCGILDIIFMCIKVSVSLLT